MKRKITLFIIYLFSCCIFTIIKSNAQCVVTVSYTPESCFNCCDGIAQANFFSNGPACSPYSMLWSTIPPQNTFWAFNLCAGIYTVTVTDNGDTNCCSSTTASFTLPPFLTGVINYNRSNINFEIFPNPSTTKVTINIGNPSHRLNGGQRVQLSNTLGEVVMQRALTPSPSEEELRLDVSSLRAGIYFITLTDEEGNKTMRKVVKM